MKAISIAWSAVTILGLLACDKNDAADRADETLRGAKPPTSAGRAPASAGMVPSAASAPAPQPSAKDLTYNVIVVLVDSMRADMPWAGYERKIAPNLTALEAQSVSYGRGYAVSSYTAKSVAALLSGKYPSSLFRTGPFFTKYPDGNLFLAELLQQNEVATWSGQAHMYMKPGNGLDQGFDQWKVVEGIRFDNTTDRHVTSQKLTPLAISMLEAVPKGKRFFGYLHYMDPHDQYVKHEEAPDFGTGLRDRYDSEMFYTDLWIGKLLDYCKAQPWWQETVVIVSADHGEAFGEHKMHRHAFELWNVLTHVPLFFHIPGVEGRKIDTPRSHIDLAPTILDLLQIEVEHDFVGKSLHGELFGGEAKPRPVVLDLPRDTNNPERRAVIQGDYKLLVFDGWRYDLYNLAKDPGEEDNLAKQEPEKLAEMKELYESTWKGIKAIKPFGGNKLTGGGVANGPMK